MVTSEKRAALTKRQRDIFEFLKDKIINRGYGPTVREIGEHFEIKSPNGVMCHLKALEKKGLIRRESNMSRAICLSELIPKRLALPLIGTAVSGSPIQSAVSSEEQVEFEPVFTGGRKECLRIQGSAFQSLGIVDGDYVIVLRGEVGPEGSLVAALDDRHSVTLCRAPKDGDKLQPAIAGAFPTPTRQILGQVVGVVRNLEQAAVDVSPALAGTNGHAVSA